MFGFLICGIPRVSYYRVILLNKSSGKFLLISCTGVFRKAKRLFYSKKVGVIQKLNRKLFNVKSTNNNHTRLCSVGI